MGRQQLARWCRYVLFAGSALAIVVGTAIGTEAQALEDLQTPDTPLVLKAQGSFFVGGEKADHTEAELGSLGPAGHIAVNLMYVRFMVPQVGAGNVPLVMVHGATLTGKSWETTPDGRMGWDEYFVRKGHPVYVPDQGGARAIWLHQAVFNAIRAGKAPTSPRCFDSAAKSSGRTFASAPRRSSRTQDTNNLQIADLILQWINEKVGASPRRNK